MAFTVISISPHAIYRLDPIVRVKRVGMRAVACEVARRVVTIPGHVTLVRDKI